jgi:hypothetical protein
MFYPVGGQLRTRLHLQPATPRTTLSSKPYPLPSLLKMLRNFSLRSQRRSRFEQNFLDGIRIFVFFSRIQIPGTLKGVYADLSIFKRSASQTLIID